MKSCKRSIAVILCLLIAVSALACGLGAAAANEVSPLAETSQTTTPEGLDGSDLTYVEPSYPDHTTQGIGDVLEDLTIIPDIHDESLSAANLWENLLKRINDFIQMLLDFISEIGDILGGKK